MKKIKTYLFYVLSVHLLALLFMGSQRIILLLTNWQHIADVESKFSWISSSLLRGLWFDNVIACYISIAPLAILCILGLFNIVKKQVFIACNIFYIAVYTLIFSIGVANIPYFHYFFKHLNNSIFNWKEEGGTALGMVTEETSYYIYFIFFLLSIILFGFLLFKISKKIFLKEQINIKNKEYFIYAPISILLIGLCIFGMRGRTGYHSIRTSQAYFCTNPFLNQLGINPSFYLMRDIIESNRSFLNVDNIITEEKAIPIVQAALDIDSNTHKGTSPIYRKVVTEGEIKNLNIVLVFMESMSSDYLDIIENGQEITPYLNQLKNESYYFNNFYSAGTHTNHGVLATLYGLPSLFDKNMMKNVDIPLCQGLPNTLQEQGYHTMFFMTHEAQYDNMNAFLLDNGIEEIYAQEDYPTEKRRNAFGVADDFLMEYGLNKINERAKENKPFFASLLTISNHPPYIVPEEYKKRSKEIEYQAVAFADDVIRKFMEGAKKQEWYNNTIFIFVGDHGRIVGSQTYDMPLSYNHIPLIIYSPSFIDTPQQFDQLGGQVDVFPTVMGLLNRSYTNNTFGVDLFKEDRSCMFFSSDDALGCIDKEDFYSYNFKANIEGLYKYRENNPQNFIEQNKNKADSMKTYSAAMLQTASYMFKNRLLRVDE